VSRNLDISRLLRLKQESDRGNYEEKRRIFREMYSENPDSFVVDSEDAQKRTLGITHVPTNFRFHLTVPQAVEMPQKTASDEAYRKATALRTALVMKYAADNPLRAHIRSEAEKVDTDPSEARKESGNYRKGHIRLHGLSITIENPKGSTRSGKSPDGKSWEVKMPAHYGYIRSSDAVDGDQVDVYIGPVPESEKVFVVDQIDPATGKFDEHKVFLGCTGEDQVRDLYDKGFSDESGPKRRKSITPISVGALKVWVRGGILREPFAPDSPRQKQASGMRKLHSLRVVLKNGLVPGKL